MLPHWTGVFTGRSEIVSKQVEVGLDIIMTADVEAKLRHYRERSPRQALVAAETPSCTGNLGIPALDKRVFGDPGRSAAKRPPAMRLSASAILLRSKRDVDKTASIRWQARVQGPACPERGLSRSKSAAASFPQRALSQS